MEKKPWGYHTIIDLKNCDPYLISDEEYITKFVIKLCDLIKMTRYGDPIVVRFGKNPSVTGYSMFQLIEESNISGHFIENLSSACLDIFSCKEYDVEKAVKFCKDYFDAEEIEIQYIERMIHCGQIRQKIQ